MFGFLKKKLSGFSDKLKGKVDEKAKEPQIETKKVYWETLFKNSMLKVKGRLCITDASVFSLFQFY